MLKKFLITIITLFILSFVGSLTTYADEEQPFYIKPVLPPNQDTNITNYISISTDKESVSQELEFLITNNTKNPIEIKMEPLNALTSPNGSIQYKPKLKEENSLLMKESYSLQNYIEIIDRIVVDGGTTELVKAKVDMERQEGTVLGAISFQTVTEDSVQENESTQFKIKNETNNIIGVQVNFSTDKEIDFSIGDPFIDPMPSYYAIRLPLTLNSPLLIKGALLDYQVWDFNGTKVFGTEIGKPFDFAPETKVNIAIPWEYEELTEGKEYKVTGSLKYDGQEFPFEKTFTYSKNADVKSSNQGNRSVPTINDSNKIIPIVGLALATSILLFILWKRRAQYVLFSNDSVDVEIINEENELFHKIKHIKVANNDESYPLVHYFKPIKKKRNEIIAYKYNKTKNTRVLALRNK